jgi:hypothetical protein
LAASSVEITVSDRSFVWIRVAICVLRLAWVDGAHRTSLWSVCGCQKAVERARVTHRIRRIPLPLLFLEVTRVRACQSSLGCRCAKGYRPTLNASSVPSRPPNSRLPRFFSSTPSDFLRLAGQGTSRLREHQRTVAPRGCPGLEQRRRRTFPRASAPRSAPAAGPWSMSHRPASPRRCCSRPSQPPSRPSRSAQVLAVQRTLRARRKRPLALLLLLAAAPVRRRASQAQASRSTKGRRPCRP